MTEPVPVPVEPQKGRSPLRWVLLGCGVLTGLGILGLGGCAGLFYFIYKGTDPVAGVGAEYLRNAPELREAEGLRIERKLVGWNVSTANDGGNAIIPYEVHGAKGAFAGEAVVWLLRSGGKWSAVGARIKRGGGADIIVGKPPKERSHHSIDWD